MKENNTHVNECKKQGLDGKKKELILIVAVFLLAEVISRMINGQLKGKNDRDYKYDYMKWRNDYKLD